MQVSVVIPVYNAAAFVREAVESALAQPETAEVVLVEDGSRDNSLAVCEALAAEYEKLRLLRHPNGANRGAGATRNLGILNSRFEYVAFLDADDFYLPERFSTARDVLAADTTIEGVYEAVGTYVEDPAGRERWEAQGKPVDYLTTIIKPVAPEELFENLCRRRNGYFHLDGLTVKRAAFEKTGLFDEHLRLHQDTAMMYKLAGVTRLAPGRLEQPVAMRRVHAHNRITAPRPPAEVYEKRMLLYDTIWRWARRKLPPEKARPLLEYYLRSAMGVATDENLLLWKVQVRWLLAKRLLRNPSLARDPFYWSCFLPGLGGRLKL
ncbi:MAG: glycosyltransferase [Chloroflexi bacterium]|nr:glycosyltransferase [Chloroflexota bacterium]